MVTVVDIVNRALQTIGTRTNVTRAELDANSTNEAQQANLLIDNMREDLLRLAPWNFATRTINLTYVSSISGTLENQSPALSQWQPGLPQPPWAYEYLYPVDCIRALSIMSTSQTGFPGSLTGVTNSWVMGSPVRFKVAGDSFYVVTAAVVAAPGRGYAIGDKLLLHNGVGVSPYGFSGFVPDPSRAPAGASAIVTVTGIDANGGITNMSIVNNTAGEGSTYGGAYFATIDGNCRNMPTTRAGSGAVITPTFSPAQAAQRTVLTNQGSATLQYVANINDENQFDTLFQTAYVNLLASGLCLALKGDRDMANSLVRDVNQAVQEARAVDGNEGLTTNDTTPDFLRGRGISAPDGYMSGPYSSFDWGGSIPFYA